MPDTARRSSKLVIQTLGLALIVAFSFAVGCRSVNNENQQSGFRVVNDDLGREVSIPVSPNRVISLAPSVTEMVFAAGAGDRLIGVTSYCNFPADAEKIAKVGDTQTPNIERIVALKPDVIFVSTASQLEAFTDTLASQNIAVYVTDVRDLRGVSRTLRAFGTIFGTSETADLLADNMEKKAEAAGQQANGNGKPKVFIQISKEPLFTVGTESFLTEIVFRAGGISLTKDISGGYPKISKEAALAMDPDVIILSDSEDNREPNDVFTNSKAVKNGRIIRVNADILSRPGPRLVDALELIAKVLHK